MHDAVDAPVYGASLIVGAAKIHALRTFLIFGDMDGVLDQLVNTFVFGCGDRHDGNAERFLHLIDQDGTAVFAHFVHHIERNNHGNV